jgi:uncharacterized protein YbjT (DUF2867 family)
LISHAPGVNGAETERVRTLIDGKILVTGTTGTQGGAVTAALQHAGVDVAVLVRPGGAERVRPLLNGPAAIVEGNLDDIESLAAACKGCTGVFSVQPAPFADQDSERRQAGNLIRAAKDAGVQHFVHTSVSGTGWRTNHPNVDPGMMLNYWNSKEEVEAMVRDARFPVFTILKPAFMMENFIAPKVDFMFPHLRAGELLVGTATDTAFALVGAADIGSATVAALADTQRFNGAEIELAGDAPTMAEIAAVIENVTGRPVTAACVSMEEAGARLGAMSWTAQNDWLGRVGYPARPVHAEAVGLSTTPFTVWAHQHRAALKAATTPHR